MISINDDSEISVKGTPIDLLKDLSCIMVDLMENTPINEDALMYALAVAIKTREKLQRGNHLRESFVDKLFE